MLRHDAMPEMGLAAETFKCVELHDHGGKTRMTLVDGPYDEARGSAETGWNMACDKLTALP